MSDILDYVAWRGDLSFIQSPLNEVDALILSQLSYLNMGGIVPESFTSGGITLSDCYDRFFSAPDFESRSNVGMLINKKTFDLFKSCASSVRFGSLMLSGFVEKIDYEREEQFCAVMFGFGSGRKDGWNFIAYRGTDDTIVGWKEDFNLGYMDTVPAQKDAVEYLESAAMSCKRILIIGGHSKGGNLALYAGSHVSESVKKRLLWIFNNDGPGFSTEFFTSPEYKSVADKERSFVPRLSVVGMLFSRSDRVTAVENSEKNIIMQHDPFTWSVLGCRFVTCRETGRESRMVDRAVNEWFSEMSREERELFVETVFAVLKDTDAKTNTELSSNLLENAARIIKAASRLSPSARNNVTRNFHQLIKCLIDAGFNL